MTTPGSLPVHGFVLAGGKSSRMGRDKATLSFAGQTLVERATGALRTFCAEVGICGNRPDLDRIASVVPETRFEAGPVAGLEAGLRAASEEWALFVPVDVPLMPPELLRAWAVEVLARAASGVRLSFLQTNGVRQPTFCLLRRDCLSGLTQAADAGIYKLRLVFEAIASGFGDGALWIAEAASLRNDSFPEMLQYFQNVNTPADLERLAAHLGMTAPE